MGVTFVSFEVMGTIIYQNESTGQNQDFRIKVDLPTFDGALDIESFLNRIYEVDRFFDYASTPKDKQVKLVAYKLKGAAGIRWDNVQTTQRRQG